MIRRYLGLFGLSLSVAACGYSQKEMDQAKAEQQAAYEQKMADLAAEKDQELASKSTLIEGLESQVTALGGELGDRTSQLASTTTELDQLRKMRAEAEREAEQLRALTSKLKSMIDAGKLQVEMRDGRISLKLPDAILFPSGSTRLKQDGKATLAEVAGVLRDVKGRQFLVAGHTDNVPLRAGGRYRDNWALSTARAVEVLRLMIKEGVDPTQLAAAGYGSYDPIAPNDTPEGRKQNRRLEIILMPQIEKLDGSGAPPAKSPATQP